MSDYEDVARDPASPIRPRTWDVFISHAREDSAIARSLGAAVESRGLSAWLDVKLKAGEAPLQVINQALRSSGAVIVLLSGASLSSRWLGREVAAALDLLPRECVFPISVGEVDVRTLPSWLADRQWLHLRDGRHVNKLVDQLVPALEAALGTRESDEGSARVIGDLPPRVPVIGVGAYLRELRTQRTGVTWIVGSGGMGKTQLAREYAFQVRNEVDFIWWLSGSRTTTLQVDLQLGRAEEAPGPADQGTGLIVVDELDAVSDELAATVARLGTLGKSHRVLITTRRISDSRSMSAGDYRVLTVGPLSQVAVADYLDSFAPDLPPRERAQLAHIAESIGGSPLLLRLVTRALRTHSVEGVLTSPATPETTLTHTIQVLQNQLSEGQRRRLDVLAFCSGLLTKIRTNEHWELPGDEPLFTRLLDWGLCVARGGETLFAHVLIVELLRRNAPRQAVEDAIAYVSSRLPDPRDADSRALLPSIVELTELTELDWNPAASGDLAELLIWQASVWRSAGEYERAELLCPRAIMLAGESEQTLLRIRAMNLQSALAFDRGRINEASDIERRTADFAVSALGPDHPIAIASLANLATSLRAQGDLAEAITLLRRVVEQSRTILPSGHPDLVAGQINLAICLREAGLFEEAMLLLSEATVETTDSRIRLQFDQVLAAVLSDLQRFEEASAVLTEGLARAEEAFASAPSEVLMARANLAMVYARLGRRSEALAIQSDVVDRFELILGSDHPSTLSARSNYATLLAQVGLSEEALRLFLEVAEDRKRTLGPEHPDTLQSRLLAARALRNQGRTEHALAIYSDLLARVMRVLGPDHAMTFTVREELARQFGFIGDAQRAYLAYRELLADLERALPPDHPMVRRVQTAAAEFAS